MLLLERRTVSRKTRGDGKLEITAATARRLERHGAELPVLVGSVRSVGVLSEMPCTCRKAGGAHSHHFLESELFRTLAPERLVHVELDEETATVQVTASD